MKHPLLTNTRNLIIYGMFWVFIAGANAAVFNIYYDMPPDKALQVPFIEYILFGGIALSIWYVVKYNPVEANPWWKLGFFHIIAATVLIILWVYLSNLMVSVVNPDLTDFMTMSVPSRILMGYLLYVLFVFFFMVIVYYENFREKVKREGELKALIREAELHALKSQINPHFLFNSLNSISSLTMSDPAKAQEMVINLSSLMRYSLKHGQNETVAFGTELQNIKLYLSIEKVRFGKKLQPVFSVDDICYQAQLPNMILQPILENAIKYGVYEATEPVEILIQASCTGEMLEISVSNSYDAGVRSKKGEGIGLRNIRERLQIIYGNPGLLKVKDSRKYFTITLNIPQK